MIRRLLSFRDRYYILHLTWFAFFLSFVVWFNMAPLATTIQQDLKLTTEQLKVLAICNLALTIPARIVVGMILDRFGPRLVFSALLVLAFIPCSIAAIATNFNQLVWSSLATGIMGSGFVVGVRMVAEWFPPEEIGFAQGIYGGWGNFGAAAAQFTLPALIGVTLLCAYFVQAGAGATFSLVPLIKQDITGQIAGIVGAYGNVGGVVYLTVYNFTNTWTLFSTMGVLALICASLCGFFLQEPSASFAENDAIPKVEQSN